MAMIYPFMQKLRESPFPAPGHSVEIKSFIPESGTEVRLHLLNSTLEAVSHEARNLVRKIARGILTKTVALGSYECLHTAAGHSYGEKHFRKDLETVLYTFPCNFVDEIPCLV